MVFSSVFFFFCIFCVLAGNICIAVPEHFHFSSPTTPNRNLHLVSIPTRMDMNGWGAQHRGDRAVFPAPTGRRPRKKLNKWPEQAFVAPPATPPATILITKLPTSTNNAP